MSQWRPIALAENASAAAKEMEKRRFGVLGARHHRTENTITKLITAARTQKRSRMGTTKSFDFCRYSANLDVMLAPALMLSPVSMAFVPSGVSVMNSSMIEMLLLASK